MGEGLLGVLGGYWRSLGLWGDPHCEQLLWTLRLVGECQGLWGAAIAVEGCWRMLRVGGP